MKAIIYSLRCPFSGELRYIGQTITPISVRLYGHSIARDKRPITVWYKLRLSLGTPPRCRVLERCSPCNRFKRERHWINKCLDKGMNLLNDDLKLRKRKRKQRR